MAGLRKVETDNLVLTARDQTLVIESWDYLKQDLPECGCLLITLVNNLFPQTLRVIPNNQRMHPDWRALYGYYIMLQIKKIVEKPRGIRQIRRNARGLVHKYKLYKRIHPDSVNKWRAALWGMLTVKFRRCPQVERYLVAWDNCLYLYADAIQDRIRELNQL